MEWLTPGPMGEEVTLRWPPDDGPFELRPHLAFVDGRTVIVGIDIRSFVQHDDGTRAPVNGEAFSEVDAALLHSLRISEISDRSRIELAAFPNVFSFGRGTDEMRDEYRRRTEMLTTRGSVRKRRPAAGDQELSHVADLYRAALAAGGEPARKPAKYVHEHLAESGVDVTPVQVRKWIARARREGLLAPTTERKPG